MMSRMLRRYLSSGALAIALLAGACVLAAALGVWLEIWTFRTGFTLLRYGAWLGLAGGGLALVALGVGQSRVQAAVALILALVVVGLPWSWQQQARAVPPIHDISTDLDDPPPFVAIAPLRADAPNPVAYAGPETAAQQREAYPDVQPRYLAVPPGDALAAAERAARSLGWTVVDVSPEDGRLEAYDTTFWFRFVDDVVVRVRPEGSGSRVDVRSKSRVGRSDVGTNAARVRRFLAEMDR
jgi:uncharacterized protein (DUF1499 family)